MIATSTRAKMMGVFAAVALCATLAPANAFAASVNNSISCNKSSVTVGQTMTMSCSTKYTMLGVGPVGAPFMSDWLTEIPSAYFAAPTATSYTGTTNGSWSKTTGIRVSGSVWQQKTSPSWFYGDTTWSGKYTVKATASSGSAKTLGHGQTTRINTSEGPTSFTTVKTVK